MPWQVSGAAAARRSYPRSAPGGQRPVGPPPGATLPAGQGDGAWVPTGPRKLREPQAGRARRRARGARFLASIGSWRSNGHTSRVVGTWPGRAREGTVTAEPVDRERARCAGTGRGTPAGTSPVGSCRTAGGPRSGSSGTRTGSGARPPSQGCPAVRPCSTPRRPRDEDDVVGSNPELTLTPARRRGRNRGCRWLTQLHRGGWPC